jgi:sulfopropanediol 3-dehydrogenase
MVESYATDLQDYAHRELGEEVAEIIDAVRRRGDAAVRELALRAHGSVPAELRLSAAQIRESADRVPADMTEELACQLRRIRAVAQAQRDSLRDCETDVTDGWVHGVRHVPVGASATYLSGPLHDISPQDLASFQTGIVLARHAGVPRVVACVRPADPAAQSLLVTAADMAGADEIYLLDGVQAVAALALGTESVDRVDVAAGCGDALTAQASWQLFGDRGVDLAGRAGGLLVVADDAADASRAAGELLAAVLSDPDARAVLVTASPRLAEQVETQIETKLRAATRCGEARSAWTRRGTITLVADAHAACALADRFAFGRVRIMTQGPRWYLDRMRRCGAVVLGADVNGSGVDGAAVVPASVRSCSPRQHRALWIGHFLRAVGYSEWVGDRPIEPSTDPMLLDDLMPAFAGPGR